MKLRGKRFQGALTVCFLMAQAMPSGAPLVYNTNTKTDRQTVEPGEPVRVEVTLTTDAGVPTPEPLFPNLSEGVTVAAAGRSQSISMQNGTTKNTIVYSYSFSFTTPGQAEIPAIAFQNNAGYFALSDIVPIIVRDKSRDPRLSDNYRYQLPAGSNDFHIRVVAVEPSGERELFSGKRSPGSVVEFKIPDRERLQVRTFVNGVLFAERKGHKFSVPAATPSKPVSPPRLSAQVSFSEPSGNDALDAEEKATLRLTLANAGPGLAQGLRLAVESSGTSGLRFSSTPEGLVKEYASDSGNSEITMAMKLGDLAAGKTLVKEIALEAADALGAGKAKVTVEVKEANGFDAPPVVVEFETRALKAPRLELAGVSIGGLGLIKAGEIAPITLAVKNAGSGAALDATASLAVGSSDIFVSGEALASLGTLEPGQSKRIEFQFVVNNRFKGKALPLSVTLAESRGKYGAEVPLGLALGESAPEVKVVSVKGKAEAAAPESASLAESVDAAPASKTPADPEAFAVVIGIEKYRQQGIPAVDFAARDARAVQSYLTRTMGFPEENVILLQNEKAAKTDLEKYLGKWLKNQVSNKSRVFIYYAGHGAPNPATGEGYLIPYDGDPNYTEETAFPIKRLYEVLAKLPVRSVTVALDACFSGQGGRSVLAKGARPLVNVAAEPQSAGANTVVITATQGNQISTSYPDGQHGLMTYFLLKGLRGEGDSDRDGKVTTGELFGYLKSAVSRQARRQNVEQVPTIIPSLDQLGARGGEVWLRDR